uniref:Putative monoacylglycerol lipase abhd12 n=1 Tax=Xenopsylla cheopis TaxID=163159 RepID=A0A6M2DL80_XENCH
MLMLIIFLQKAIVFMNFVKYDENFDYTRADELEDIKNIYISYCDPELKLNTCKIVLGVWHIIAKDGSPYLLKPNRSHSVMTNMYDAHNNDFIGEVRASFSISDESMSLWNFGTGAEMADGKPVVLYLHGNSGTRALYYRFNTYKLLQRLGCHVIAMDYRSFGDSTNVEPTENGVMKDALAVYKWLSSVARGPIVLWGHSLGSAIATHMLCHIQGKMNGPSALILESPFTNFYEEIYAHKFSLLFRFLPWFDYTIRKPILENGFLFKSDQYVSCFHQPILFLHAEDDKTVPLELGHKLFTIAKYNRDKSWGPIQFHRYDASKNLGHRYITLDNDTYVIVRDFLSSYAAERY